VGIIKFEEYFERPAIAAAFRVEQQCHAGVKLPIVIGPLDGAHSNERRLDLVGSLQPGRQVWTLQLFRTNPREIGLHKKALALGIKHQFPRGRF
jgi:hypothetical protein